MRPRAVNAIEMLPRNDRRRALEAERRARKSGDWGPWETLHFPPFSAGSGGWASEVTSAHKNRVFSVLDRDAGNGVRHLAVASLSQERPTFWEMQRIKDDLAGEAATAVEVYPPRSEVVDGADMFHLWVLPEPLSFSLHHKL